MVAINMSMNGDVPVAWGLLSRRKTPEPVIGQVVRGVNCQWSSQQMTGTNYFKVTDNDMWVFGGRDGPEMELKEIFSIVAMGRVKSLIPLTNLQSILWDEDSVNVTFVPILRSLVGYVECKVCMDSAAKELFYLDLLSFESIKEHD
ncbi:hypothetical protein Tco_1378736 [Tanacetum coccineum]